MPEQTPDLVSAASVVAEELVPDPVSTRPSVDEMGAGFARRGRHTVRSPRSPFAKIVGFDVAPVTADRRSALRTAAREQIA